jgi:hypothetical protein
MGYFEEFTDDFLCYLVIYFIMSTIFIILYLLGGIING